MNRKKRLRKSLRISLKPMPFSLTGISVPYMTSMAMPELTSSMHRKIYLKELILAAYFRIWEILASAEGFLKRYSVI